MNKQEIFAYLLDSINRYTLREALWNLLVTFLVVSFVFFIYRITNRGVLFNSGFGLVILLTGLVTAVIMMIIESNLALSLGMVGALSIIRFRSAIKDPRDTGFIFWSVAMGLCAGTGNYGLALASALVIGALVLVYSFLIQPNPAQLLVVHTGKGAHDTITKILDENKARYKLKMRDSRGGVEEYIYEIRTRDADGILDALSADESVSSVSIVAGGEEK